MRKISKLFSIAFLFFPALLGAQSLTPNLQLQVPSYQQVNWQVPIDYDLLLLDTVLGGSQTLISNSTSPTINNSPNWVTANTSPVTISNFLNGFPGQTIHVICGAGDIFTSIATGTNILLGASWSCATSPAISLTLIGTIWTETGRAGATGGGGGGGLSDPGANGIVFRNALNTTTVATLSNLTSLGAVPNTLTINGIPLSSNITLGYSNLAAGTIANGTVATTQSVGDSTSKVATDAFVLGQGFATGGPFVPTTRTVNGNALSGNVTITFPQIAAGALANGTTATTQSNGDNTTDVATDAFVHSYVGAQGFVTGGPYVPTSTTINGNALSTNVTLTFPQIAAGALANGTTATTQTNTDNTTKLATDAFVQSYVTAQGFATGGPFVPTTRTINGNALSSNVTLTFPQIAAGALANGTTATTQSTSDNTTDVATDAFVNAYVAAQGFVTGGPYVPTTRTVNGNALTSNVTISASQLTTGNLPCAQLPSFTGDVTFTSCATQVTTTHLSAPLPLAQGGTGTASPALVAGSGITITGSWPNQTIAANLVNLATGVTGLLPFANLAQGSPPCNTQSFSATPTYSLGTDLCVETTLSGNITAITISGSPSNGRVFYLHLTQSGSGGDAVTWPSNFLFPSGWNLNTSAGATNNMAWQYDSTNWVPTSDWGSGGGSRSISWSALAPATAALNLNQYAGSTNYSTTLNFTNSGNLAGLFLLYDITAATSTSSPSSPELSLCANEWTTVSTEGCFDIQFVPGSGPNANGTFEFVHGGAASGTYTFLNASGPIQSASNNGAGGMFGGPEGTAPSNLSSGGNDNCYNSSSTHSILCSWNADGPYQIARTVFSGTLSLPTSSVGSGACVAATPVTATGVATTDIVTASFNGDPSSTTGYLPSTSGSLYVYVWPTVNTINAKVCNNTGLAIVPGAATLNVRVAR